MKSRNEITQLDRHLVQTIDPPTLVDAANVAKVATIYLDKILGVKYPLDVRRSIITKLTSFPTHDFVIQSDLAQELGLCIEDSHNHKNEWHIMCRWLGKYITEAEDTHFVRYATPQK